MVFFKKTDSTRDISKVKQLFLKPLILNIRMYVYKPMVIARFQQPLQYLQMLFGLAAIPQYL